MSVLIKGLTKEKVESCFRFAKDGWCIFDMPEIIEVPPHGRLIDADALMRSFHDEFDDEEVHDFECGAYWFHGSVINHVINSPTIIPAEEGEI